MHPGEASGTKLSFVALMGTKAPPETTEPALVARALEGDRDAWSALIARHQRRVLLMLLARGVRVDRARDIAQETWARLVAHQRAGRLDRLELPGLALKQAEFLALDEARRMRRDGDDASKEEVAFLRDPAPSIEDRLVSRSELARARAELDRCSARARRVFLAVYENPEVPQAVTAERLGLSVDRLRHALGEIRARLRGALDDDRPPLAFTRGQKETTDE